MKLKALSEDLPPMPGWAVESWGTKSEGAQRVWAWANAIQQFIEDHGFETIRQFADEIVVGKTVEKGEPYPNTRIWVGEGGKMTIWHSGPPGTTKPQEVDIHDPTSFDTILDFVKKYYEH